MKKKSKRKFAPVPKTKKGTPTKYVRGAKNPKALAAHIGREKYGKKKFQKLAAKGKRRKG